MAVKMKNYNCLKCGQNNQSNAKFCNNCQSLILKLESGKLEDQFEVVLNSGKGNVLGEGSFGIVYEAVDLQLQRPVALKILTSQEPDDITRFQKEAFTLASLSHPGIPAIYGINQKDGVHYILMEMIKGKTLLEMLEEKLSQTNLPFDEQKTRNWGIEICDILSKIHEKGLIYRDLKPGNLIQQDSGNLVLVDFGTARDSKGTNKTAIFTPGFGAPEQLVGKGDHRLDIYGTGATMFCLITGENPGDLQHQFNLPPLRQVNNAASQDLERILARATAFDPNSRHQTADELKKDLQSQQSRTITIWTPGSNIHIRNSKIKSTSFECASYHDLFKKLHDFCRKKYDTTAQPVITLNSGKQIYRPLTFKEFAEAIVTEHERIIAQDKNDSFTYHPISFPEAYYTSTAIVQKAGTSKFKVINLAEDLINQVYDNPESSEFTTDYDSVNAPEFQSEEDLLDRYNRSVSMSNAIQHPGLLALVEGDFQLLENFLNVIKTVYSKRGTKGTMPYSQGIIKGFNFSIPQNPSADLLTLATLELVEENLGSERQSFYSLNVIFKAGVNFDQHKKFRTIYLESK